MAAKTIVPTKLEFNTAGAFTTNAFDTETGNKIEFTGNDGKILIVNTGTGTAKVQIGNGIQGVGTELQIAQNKCAVLESGKFKRVSGANKGYVMINGASASIAVVELP